MTSEVTYYCVISLSHVILQEEILIKSLNLKISVSPVCTGCDEEANKAKHLSVRLFVQPVDSVLVKKSQHRKFYGREM